MAIAAPSHTLLHDVPAEVLQRLAELYARFGTSLAARTTLQLGGHTSAQQGSSVEFHEHREYALGDDLRRVDWRTSARSDRLFVKRFDHEGQVARALVVDASASMQLGDHGVTKLAFACRCLAALGYVFDQTGDPLRIAAVADRPGGVAALSAALPLPDALTLLTQIAATNARHGARSLAQDLEHLAAQLATTPCEMIVASDFFDRGDVAGILHAMVARGHAITVLMVLAPAELALPYRGLTTFVSPESGATMVTNPADIRLRYVDAIRRHVSTWQQRCLDAGMRFVLGTTDLEETCSRLLGIAPSAAGAAWA